MHDDGLDFFRGLLLAMGFSGLFWISLFGWFRLIRSFF